MKKENQQTIDRWHRAEGMVVKPIRSGLDGNLNHMTHGIWANQCLNEDERKTFRDFVGRLCSDFEFNESSDYMQVELVAIYYLKLIRAMSEENLEAAERIDRMFRSSLKDLKATKITRQKEEPTKREMTPAEWATSFIEKMRKKQEEEEKAGEKSAKLGKQEKNA